MKVCITKYIHLPNIIMNDSLINFCIHKNKLVWTGYESGDSMSYQLEIHGT